MPKIVYADTYSNKMLLIAGWLISLDDEELTNISNY